MEKYLAVWWVLILMSAMHRFILCPVTCLQLSWYLPWWKCVGNRLQKRSRPEVAQAVAQEGLSNHKTFIQRGKNGLLDRHRPRCCRCSAAGFDRCSIQVHHCRAWWVCEGRGFCAHAIACYLLGCSRRVCWREFNWSCFSAWNSLWDHRRSTLEAGAFWWSHSKRCGTQILPFTKQLMWRSQRPRQMRVTSTCKEWNVERGWIDLCRHSTEREPSRT